MNVVIVAGTRPNFVKVAPLLRAINLHNVVYPARKIEYKFVHTGQHYDYQMSQALFEDFQLPEPDLHLGISSGTHAEQTGKIMIEIEKVLLQEKPDLVIVVGDVNSTLAAGLAAVKIHIPIAHIEAGLRSYDFTYPEEVNRLLTDAVSSYLFTPSKNANKNLTKEGISQDRIFFVGNILADSIYSQLEVASRRPVLSNLGLEKQCYAVLTMHRPSNVDNKETLVRLMNTIKQISERITIIYPIHPRTQKSLKLFGLEREFCWIDINHPQPINKFGLYLTEPLSYLDFLQMESNSKFVITDSGGLQSETTILNIPCLTLLEQDLWPLTTTEGTNILVGTDPKKILKESSIILDGNGNHKEGAQPEYWDGKTAERIVTILDLLWDGKNYTKVGKTNRLRASMKGIPKAC
jgi:UDP-N-acetylglucosamine 2-epimerase (non-hydrolysing)